MLKWKTPESVRGSSASLTIPLVGVLLVLVWLVRLAS